MKKRRMTDQRAAVLAVVRESGEHLSAQEVYDRVRPRQPGIAVATVYNSLKFLCDAGELQSMHLGSGATLYEANSAHHHHLVCSSCGGVRDLALSGMSGPLDELGRETGFKMQRADITFVGVCPACQEGRD